MRREGMPSQLDNDPEPTIPIVGAGLQNAALNWTFLVGRTGLKPLTRCASRVFGKFRAVHWSPPQTPDQDFLFSVIHCRSYRSAGVAVHADRVSDHRLCPFTGTFDS
jgi:hypothetical protein